MPPLSDDALVVRGGACYPENFMAGNGVSTDGSGLLADVSVQCAPGKTAQELSRKIFNGQIGVTTVGSVREERGRVDPDPTPGNPDHCLLRDIDAETASRLFQPTVRNPNRVR